MSKERSGEGWCVELWCVGGVEAYRLRDVSSDRLGDVGWGTLGVATWVCMVFWCPVKVGWFEG